MKRELEKLEKRRVTNWLRADWKSAESVKGEDGAGRLVPTGTDSDGTETNRQWAVREVARLKAKGVKATVKATADDRMVAVYANLTPAEEDLLRSLRVDESDLRKEENT